MLIYIVALFLSDRANRALVPLASNDRVSGLNYNGLSWSEFTEHFIENTQEETDGMTCNSKRQKYEQHTQALNNQT